MNATTITTAQNTLLHINYIGFYGMVDHHSDAAHLGDREGRLKASLKMENEAFVLEDIVAAYEYLLALAKRREGYNSGTTRFLEKMLHEAREARYTFTQAPAVAQAVAVAPEAKKAIVVNGVTIANPEFKADGMKSNVGKFVKWMWNHEDEDSMWYWVRENQAQYPEYAQALRSILGEESEQLRWQWEGMQDPD